MCVVLGPLLHCAVTAHGASLLFETTDQYYTQIFVPRLLLNLLLAAALHHYLQLLLLI